MSVEGDVSTKKLEDLTAAEMTSKDYYFDSYAHFGIHEVSTVNVLKPLLFYSYCLKLELV